MPLSQIEIGFVQHVKFESYSSTYGNGVTLKAKVDGTDLAGKTYLDGSFNADGQVVPWYHDTTFRPQSGANTWSFNQFDRPDALFPITSDQAKFVNGFLPATALANGKGLATTKFGETFTLDLTARTLDPAGANKYFSEARATWTVSSNGTWADGKWTADMGSGVITSPNSWSSLAVTTPTPVDIAGPISNYIVQDKMKFASD